MDQLEVKKVVDYHPEIVIEIKTNNQLILNKKCPKNNNIKPI